MNKTKIYQNYKWLCKNYNKLKSIYSVAGLCGSKPRTIHYWLIKYNIKRVGQLNYKHSQATKNKIGLKSKGRKPMLNKKHSEVTKSKMSNNRKGKDNGNWKGGKTKRIRQFRKTKEYVRWRNKVVSLANNRCSCCQKLESIEAHHIVSIHENLKNALSVSNGIALCHECHVLADKKRRSQ